MVSNGIEGFIVPSICAAPRHDVNLKPGGYHIMLMGLNNKPALNDRIHLNLSFENHEDITINPIVKLRPPMMNKHE